MYMHGKCDQRGRRASHRRIPRAPSPARRRPRQTRTSRRQFASTRRDRWLSTRDDQKQSLRAAGRSPLVKSQPEVRQHAVEESELKSSPDAFAEFTGSVLAPEQRLDVHIREACIAERTADLFGSEVLLDE